ncbi:MAG: serine/threonine-protein kinase [Myxococcota bacterium]
MANAMASTERIETTKTVTPPKECPRTGVLDEDGASLSDDGDEDDGLPLPEPNSRMGRYVVLDAIGQGGMGVVYTAYDHELDRKVALKLLRVHQNSSESVTEGRARLVREAKAMAQLAHPNVVTVHDVGTIDGRVFVAMEYVDGRNLRSWMLDRKHGWRDALEIFKQAGRGLAAAHEAGLVHRDFKPDNVLVGKDGRVRVTDFGLARASATVDIPRGDHRPSCSDGDLTIPGRIMGTLGYMAPEQTDGRPTDAKMDQFAYCVALFEALTGRRPFLGRTRDDLREAVEEGNIQPWSRRGRKNLTPLWLRQIVERGLDLEPGKRWPSMHALIEQLERRPLRLKWLGATAAAVVATGGIWAGAAAASSSTSQCEGAERHLAGVWDDDRRATARDAVLGAGTSHAPGTWDRLQDTLDDYTQSWVAMRTEACEATASGEQSGQLLDRRMACLDRRLDEVGALVDVLSEADDNVTDRAVWAAASLPMLSPCADAVALAASATRPQDPEHAAAVNKLRSELARAQAWGLVDKADRGLQIAADVAQRSEALDHAPLHAESLHVLGRMQARLGQSAAAEDTLSEAAMLAAAHKHEGVAAAAATDMMAVVGTATGEYKKGLLWGWYAESAVQRMGKGGVHEADMLDGLGDVMAAHGKLEEARTHYERAIDVRRELLGNDHPTVALSLSRLAEVSRRSGSVDTARTHYEAALEIQERALGSLHPDVGRLLAKLADLDAPNGGASGRSHHARP